MNFLNTNLEFEIQNPRHLLRPLLLKLFNINLYSIIFMDDYDGATLPETFTASQCADVNAFTTEHKEI